MSRTALFISLLVLLAVASAGAALWWFRQPQSNAVMRGWQQARQLGCFGCHGQGGIGGIPNPGSDEQQIPAWDGGMLMMYVEKEEEIREWILYGLPRRLWKDGEKPAPDSHHEHEHSDNHQHPAGKGLIAMPAYEGKISPGQLEDLVAFIKYAGNYNSPEPSDQARRGLAVVRRLGCEGCHRRGGLVGIPNPGSLKGYVPPWRGRDYQDLVRSEDELRQWILEGSIDRLEKDPLAHFFIDRQVIQMPAYRDHLSEDELDAVVSYIQWLSSTH